MKKFLFLFALVISLPAYALCPIDGESVCSMQNFKTNSNPLFQTPSSGIDTNTTPTQLQPFNSNKTNLEMQTQNNNLNYNSNCQFGNCYDNTKQETKAQ
jgi:hypothetical protein